MEKIEASLSAEQSSRFIWKWSFGDSEEFQVWRFLVIANKYFIDEEMWPSSERSDRARKYWHDRLKLNNTKFQTSRDRRDPGLCGNHQFIKREKDGHLFDNIQNKLYDEEYWYRNKQLNILLQKAKH